MVHACIHAADGRLLFRTWREALALWERLARGPRFVAATLMPTHLHAQLTGEEQCPALHTALRGFALWRNADRRESGPVFAHRERPTPIRGRDHVERTRRYIHLNPCRDGLVKDPLEWPFSTHRDALGLAAWPVCRSVHNPERFHAYVMADPDIKIERTALPPSCAIGPHGMADVGPVYAAVSALTRTTMRGLRAHGRARDLLILSLRVLTQASSRQIAEIAGVEPSTVRRCPRLPSENTALVARVLGDPRFLGLRDGDLRSAEEWSRFCRMT